MSFSRNRTDRCIAENPYRRRRDLRPQVGMKRVARGEVHFATEQSRQVIPQVHEGDKPEALIIHISDKIDVRASPGVSPGGRAIEVKRGHAPSANGIGVRAKLLDDQVAAHDASYHRVWRRASRTAPKMRQVAPPGPG